MARGANDIGSILYQSKYRKSTSHPNPYAKSTSSTRPQPINQILKGTLNKDDFFVELGERKRKVGKTGDEGMERRMGMVRSDIKNIESRDSNRPKARKKGSIVNEKQNEKLNASASTFPYDISAILSHPNLAGLPLQTPSHKSHSSKPASSSPTASPSNRQSEHDRYSCSSATMNGSLMVTNLEEQAEEWERFGVDEGGEDVGAKEERECETANEA